MRILLILLVVLMGCDTATEPTVDQNGFDEIGMRRDFALSVVQPELDTVLEARDLMLAAWANEGYYVCDTTRLTADDESSLCWDHLAMFNDDGNYNSFIGFTDVSRWLWGLGGGWDEPTCAQNLGADNYSCGQIPVHDVMPSTNPACNIGLPYWWNSFEAMLLVPWADAYWTYPSMGWTYFIVGIGAPMEDGGRMDDGLVMHPRYELEFAWGSPAPGGPTFGCDAPIWPPSGRSSGKPTRTPKQLP